MWLGFEAMELERNAWIKLNWEGTILKTCEDLHVASEGKKEINSKITGLSNWVEEGLNRVGVCLHFAGKQRNPFNR